ncbi:MAG TPA: trans-aconitate 2-methyltransferase [Jatrophihabitantaceae bacterium]|jgi:trans-aconitate 2-methyltransferase|nr:trans-aconitate 2-methyltransferase [Jatrophihabitantaceae bacterium]
MRWDPSQYGRFAVERGRPFLDLVARIGAEAPRRVVDLGCGTGELTALLAARWPDATVEGIDSSTEMIAKARALDAAVTFSLVDVATWAPPDDVDVIVSNAVLQWVPTHRVLLASWASALPAGGWLAFQVPGNFDAPAHTAMRELAESPRWADSLHDVLRHHDAVDEPSSYARLLLVEGLEVDVWESTYLHVLRGPDAVLEWLRGTGLRPVLAALSPSDGEEFSAELAARLSRAYPPGERGTLFPFRRIFAVAHRPS